jgi:hypothetical protein
MTETVIMYRNRSEQSIDEFLYDSGAGAWLIPIMGALIVGFLTTVLVERLSNRFYFGRRYNVNRRIRLWVGRVGLVLGGIVACLTFAHLAGPLV